MYGFLSKLKIPIAILFISAIYFIAGKIGLVLAFVHPSVSVVWLPTGIAIATLLLLGRKLWPAIFIGAFLVNITNEGSLLTTLGIATGNTLEAFIAVWLIERFANGRNCLDRPQDLFRFVLFAGIISTAVSALCGVFSLTLTGFASWENFRPLFFTWWLGDMGGAIIVAPLIISWFNKRTLNLKITHVMEIFLVFLLLFLVSLVIFGGFSTVSNGNYSVEFLVLPYLLWCAFRFNKRETATALFLLSEIAIWGTLNGFGPFAKGASVNASLFLLQAYMNTLAVTILMLAAAVIQQRQAEESAQKSEDRYRTLVDTSPDAIVVMDLQTKITMVNKQAVNMVELNSPSDILGKDAFAFIAKEDHERTRENLAKLARVKRLTGVEYTIVRRDGSRFIASTSASLLNDKKGNPQGIIVVVRDVTREKELDRMKDEFITVASHELRTPMTAVKGYLSMLLNGKYGVVNEPLRKPLVTVAMATERLIELVNDILSVSRIETKRLKMTLSVFPLRSVVEDIVLSLKPIIHEKHVALFDQIDKDVSVQADPQKLGQILTNLIGNALKFTDTGEIVLHSEEKGERMIIFVSDTGVGISCINQERLFRKFQQVSSQQAGRPAGTGLGLYISREYAKAMGGDVWVVASEEGKGSTFALSLPKSGTRLAFDVRQRLVMQMSNASLVDEQTAKHPSS